MVGHSDLRDPLSPKPPNPLILQTQTFLLSEAGGNIPSHGAHSSHHTFYSKNNGKATTWVHHSPGVLPTVP